MGASFQLSDEYGIVEVQVVEMTEAAATKQAKLLYCMSVLFEHFYKNKASHFKQRQLNGILCRCFTSLVLFLPS